MRSYESDVAAWAVQQADALRRRAANEVDWDNLAEEVEALGISQRRELRSRLIVLLQHLLKWHFQPSERSGSWRGSIMTQRSDLEAVLADSPSLRRLVPDYVREHYPEARRRALAETGLLALPEACPWSAEAILDPEFWAET